MKSFSLRRGFFAILAFSISVSLHAAPFQMQLLSDLHFEFTMVAPAGAEKGAWFNVIDAEKFDKEDSVVLHPERRFKRMLGVSYIALAGDISTLHGASLERLGWFIAYLKGLGFSTIFLVPGNHEYYTGKQAPYAVDSVFKDFATHHGVIYLNKDTYDIPGTDLRIAGCTLWTNVREDQKKNVKMLSDYTSIKKVCADLGCADKHPHEEQKEAGAGGSNGYSCSDFQMANPETTNAWHQDHKKWILSQISKARAERKKLIIITHHKPTAKLGKLSPKALQFAKDQQKSTGRSSAFEATDCDECFQSDVVKGWFYGHTHMTEVHGSLVEKGVPIFSNQVGYISKPEKQELLPNGLNENFNGQFVFSAEYESAEHKSEEHK